MMVTVQVESIDTSGCSNKASDKNLGGDYFDQGMTEQLSFHALFSV